MSLGKSTMTDRGSVNGPNSLYLEYVKEVGCGRDIIEIKGIGFISYFKHPDQIYIEDTYVRPKYRNGSIFKELFDQICEVAKKYSIDTITHAIVKTHSDFKKMEMRSLKYGFKKVGETETECCYLRSLKNG